MAVLERGPGGLFRLLNRAPSTIATFWPELKSKADSLNPADAFLFLEDFIPRAIVHWDSQPADALESGIWTELDEEGEEQLFEAIAMQIDKKDLLLIKVPVEHKTRSFFQVAREQRLEYEQLLQEINKREVLLHCIVHDLSNPLAGIKGSLSLLQDENGLDEDSNELLRIGISQAEKMQNLIRGILNTFANDVKQLLPSVVSIDSAPDIASVAEETAKSMSATAGQQQISIEVVQIPQEGGSFKVVGDQERLERVLFNLLTNAIRHAPAHSTITIRISEEEDRVTTSVLDQGNGVPDQLVSTLFDRFSQGRENAGQAGLGLYFCRLTVEQWGGKINYMENEDGGACFMFSLPKPDYHVK